MAWKPKTIGGKILKGLTIGVGVAAAAAAVVGTAGAAIPAIGGAITATSGVVGAVLKTSMKTADAVGVKAADLVSGITKEQRDLVKEQKDEAKDAAQKVTTIEKLIKAGSTVKDAAAKVGVSVASLAGMFGIPTTGQVETTGTEASLAAGTVPVTTMTADKKQLLTYGAIGLAVLFLLPKILKR